jgi:hypothetical protein
MLNFKLIKYFLITVLVIPSIYLLVLLILSIANKPVIEPIDFDASIIDSKINIQDSNTYEVNTSTKLDFTYELIGIRAGINDSSVVVKKANKEFLVVVGDKLEGTYELIEVNQNSAIFRNGNNIYKIQRKLN